MAGGAANTDDETTPLMVSSLSNNDEDDGEDKEKYDRSPGEKFPSLDFDRIVNEYSIAAALARNKHVFQKRVKEHSSSSLHDHQRKQHDDKLDPEAPHHSNSHGTKTTPAEGAQYVKLSNKGYVVTRWCLTVIVGICTGLTAAFVLYFVEVLIEFRVGRLNREIQFIDDPEYTAEIKWYDFFARKLGTPGVYLGYMVFNLMLVSISTLLCETLAPGAVSSGIPEVMSYLNGVQVGNFDNLQLYMVKLVSTIFSVSSGLVIGPEGPVVHLGSILGACVTRLGDMEWILRKLRDTHPDLAKQFGCADLKRQENNTENHGSSERKLRNTWVSTVSFYLSHFRNDLERRNLISVGAAAGFASAFGAPVGGLLYSMEEASSFFDHAMLWKTLVGTCLATSIIAIYHGDFTKYSMLSLEIGVQEENLLARFGELPLYIIMGILGGVFGGTFNNIYHIINHSRKHFYENLARKSKKRRRYILCKLLESGFVSLLTSAIMLTAPLQAPWACQEISKVESELSQGEAYVHRYNCKEGYANEMGSILFGSREASIRNILTDPTAFEANTLLTVGCIFLGLMLLTFGTSVPSGMFMPTVLTGACFGGYSGIEFQRHVISSVHPSDFALIGAAAFLSGMQRNVVSLCVILMEGTGQTKVIIPIIITVVCARSVGDLFSEGVYEIGIELKEYPYLHHGEKIVYDAFQAGDVMKTKINTVHPIETAGSLEALLLQSEEQAFAVVSKKEGQYLGIVRRDQIIAVLQCKVFLETFRDNGGVEHNQIDMDSSSTQNGNDNNTQYTIPKSLKEEDGAPETLSPWLRDNVCVVKTEQGTKLMFGVDETLPDGSTKVEDRMILKAINGKRVVRIPDEEKRYRVDVGCLMNKGAFSVSAATPLSKACNAFASLGLRHLPVLTPGGHVVGMITREELSEDHITEMMGKKLN